MREFGLQPYINKYKQANGLVDLEKLVNDPTIMLSHHMHENVKKIEVINLPNGLVYYAKPVGSLKQASAEKILSKIYQLNGFISPETTIGEMNGKLYAITNDVLPSHNTERGYIFLKKLCPGGAQNVFPSIYSFGEKSPYYKAFTPRLLRQVAKYYGYALATRNWDANYCNLNFRFMNKVHDQALSIVSIDYEKSLDEGKGYIEIKYVTPFDNKRADIYDLYRQFVEAYKTNSELVDLGYISRSIARGASEIDEVVRKAKDDGFIPDEEYIDDLKRSMDSTANDFEREM